LENIGKNFFFKERKIGKLVGINYFTRETFVLDLVDAISIRKESKNFEAKLQLSTDVSICKTVCDSLLK
jgi:hypothetical protein